MKYNIILFFILVFSVAYGQKQKDSDYTQIFCDKKNEKEGVIWKHCDSNNERFTPPDTIKLFRQENRQKLEGVEKCGFNSRCWRFFNQKHFKESSSNDKDDMESELANYKISFDRKLQKYRLTIKYKYDKKNKTYIKYDYYIYKTVQDNNNTTTKIILVKNTSR